MRVLLPLVLGIVTSLSAIGCNGIFGCEGGASIVDTAPVEAPDATAIVTEIPTCDGSTTAPRAYELTIFTRGDAGELTLFTVTITPSAPVGASSPLLVSDVDASPNGQTADSEDGSIHLVATADDDLEDTAIVAVIATIDELPSATDAILSATLEVHYLDGRVFDETFPARIKGAESCPVN